MEPVDAPSLAVKSIGEDGVELEAQVVTKPAPIVPPQPEPISKPSPTTEPVKQIAKEEKEETNFTPPPMSKKPSGNDIASLWQMLLMNIKSPSTQALLKLATPLKIAPDGVILTFKNDRLVAQINDTNKKQLVIDAVGIMFNQSNTPITIRLAQSSDKVIESTASVSTSQTTVVSQKPSQVPEQEIVNKPEVKKDVAKEITDSKEIERIESDQEKMVLDLFDGKYVE